MSRPTLLLIALLAVSLVLFGCRRDAEPDPMPEAEAELEADAYAEEEHVEPEPSVPMCGEWVVVVESPTVAGSLDGDRILRAFLDGLRSSNCDAHTSRPAGIPAGVTVLQLAPRLQQMGGGAANFAVVATDTSTGEVHSRHQERISSGDGTAEGRRLGESIAASLLR